MGIVYADLGTDQVETVNSSSEGYVAGESTTVYVGGPVNNAGADLTIDGIDAQVSYFDDLGMSLGLLGNLNVYVVNGAQTTFWNDGLSYENPNISLSYTIGDNSSVTLYHGTERFDPNITQNLAFSGDGTGSFTYIVNDDGAAVGPSQPINVTGFGAGDKIRVVEYPGTPVGAATFVYNNETGVGTLSFFDSGSTSSISALAAEDAIPFNIAGLSQAQADAIQAGLADGSAIDEEGNFVMPVCFLEGTRIATPDGERAVETLAIGDEVLGTDGRAHKVRWIGRQCIVARFADPLLAYPVRISAGALGDEMPVRDLFLSPDHALVIDGLLVQAGALVNGTTITRVTHPAPRFTYYHIEVESHAIVLAEGVPAETFVDNVTRSRFDNYAEFEALYGPDEPMIAEIDLPRVKSARQLPPALRVRLAARAGELAPAAAA